MTARNSAFFLLLVLISSLLLRMYPTTSESFQYDAVVSQLAAKEGVVANAWDTHDTYRLRRYHPPLLSYIILLNNTLFGEDAFRSRLFSILLGALACFVVSLAILRTSAGHSGALVAALFGGWLVCFLPAHLYVSRTANWDATYTLLSMCSLFFLSSHLATPSLRRLCLASVFAGLAFLVCELGFLLLPSFALAMAIDGRRAGSSHTLRRWGVAAAFVLLLIALLWPAGILKLDVIRTMRFRLYDSSVAERNLPWYMFYGILFKQSAAFTIMSALGIFSLVFAFVRTRRAGEQERHDVSIAFVALVPFLAYAATAFLLSLKHRLVYVHHVVDLLLPLTVVTATAFVISARYLPTAGKRLMVFLGVAGVIFSAVAAFNTDPHIVGPQEHPGMLGIRDFLQQYPDSKTYFYYTIVMSYYLPEAIIEGGTDRYWTPEKLESVKIGGYDFIISDQSMFDQNYTDIDALTRVLEPEYRLAHVVKHRRTGEPVAWILSSER